MDGLRILRENVARLAGQKLGRDWRMPTDTVGEMRADGVLHDIFILPTDADEFEYLQNQATGALVFMVGVDAVDGSSPIA